MIPCWTNGLLITHVDSINEIRLSNLTNMNGKITWISPFCLITKKYNDIGWCWAIELLITITNLIHNKKKGLDEEHPNEGKWQMIKWTTC
jgi:hypothetical protein